MSIKARWMQKRALREETKKKYLEHPYECPFCGSENISALEVDGEYDTLWRDVLCDDCKKMWSEIYKLVDIETEEKEKSSEETKQWQERWHKR